jgi:WD40 repeat protein
MRPSRLGSNELSLGTEGLLDQICDAFSQAWRAGGRPRVEVYLGQTQEPGRSYLVRHLILVDLEKRREAKETPTREEYRARFPDHLDLIDELFDAARTVAPSGSRERTIDYRASPGSEPALQANGLPERIGRFLVRQELGEGAFGAVYRAWDPALEREVAIKVPHPGTLSGEQRVRRFLGDARAAACLRHPNIVAVHDVGRHGETYFIASAYVEGQTLEAALKSGLDLRRGLVVLRALARALAYAHEQGVIHRDVKPANVMLDRQDQPHLIDFGLARRPELDADAPAPRASVSTGKTRLGDILGTPAYMAPEAACGKAHLASGALDQYSLGVVLYRLLTGKLPFHGTWEEVRRDVIHTDPPTPRQVRPDLPVDLDLICRKTMAKRPEDRYPSCAELADDLEHWLQGEPVSVRPPGPGERLGRFLCKERNLSAALALAGLSLLLLLVVLGVAVTTSSAKARTEEKARAEADELRDEAERRAGSEEELRRKASRAQEQAEQESREVKRLLEKVKELLDQTARERNEKEAALEKVKKLLARVEENRRREQQELYFSLVNRAAGELQRGQVERARRWLNDCPPELRCLEWRLLESATSQPRDRAASAGDIALSPDGKWIAWTNSRGNVILRHTTPPETKPPRPLDLPSRARRLAFSCDGKWLAVGCGGREVLLFAVKETPGDPRRLTVKAGPIDALAFSREGKRSNYLAVAAGKGVRVYRTTDGWRTSTTHYTLSLPAPARRLGFAPDKLVLITATLNSVLSLRDLRDLEAGQDLLTFRQFTAGAIHSLGRVKMASAIYPLGEFKAAAKEGGRIVVVDHRNQEVCQFTGHADDVEQVSIGRTPDGPVRLTSLDRANFLRVWEVPLRRGRAAPDIKELLYAVTAGAAAFSPDGKTVAWTSPDGTVRLFYPEQPRTQPPVYDLDTGGKVEARNQAQDSLDRYTQYVHSVAYSPDGKYLVTGTSVPRAGNGGKIEKLEGGEVVVWHAGSRKRALLPEQSKEPIWAVACGKGGAVAWGSRGEDIFLWNVEGKGRPRRLDGHGPKGTNALVFSPDGAHLLSAGADGSVKLWNVARRNLPATLAEPGGAPVSALAWAPDGRLLAAAGEDGRIQVWHRADDGSFERHWKGTHATIAYTVAFSGDSQLLASGGEDGLVRLWDASTGKEIQTMRGHGSAVLALAFRPGGEERLASISRDRTVRVWEVSTGREALVLPVGAAARPTLAFNPRDGEELVAGTVQGVRRWRAEAAEK